MATERRSEPRRGLVARVGLALTATGLMSAATVARAAAGVPPDWRDTVAFGLALALLVVASPKRTLPRAHWIALAALALTLAVRAPAAPLVVGAYVLLATLATFATPAPHLRPLAVAAYAIASPESFWLGSGLPIGGGLAVAAVVALAATSRALVRRDRLHPSERLRRVGYGTASLALVTMSLSRTLVVAGPGGALLDVVTLAAVLALLALAELRIRAPLRDLLATLTLLTAFTLHGVAFVAATPYGNDAVAARHHAAALLAAGHHPYADFDVRDALARFGMDPQLATHLENGDVLRTYSYPALSFLAVTPFVAAGLGDVRWADLAVVLLIAVVASRAARPAWRPFVLAALMGNDVIVRQYVLAGIDPLWALLVIGAWLARGSLWCGMLLGLALADRQLAWFAFPFVVAAAPARRRTAIVALSLALAVHLPFLATAPWPTAGGILAPLVGPLVSDGVGIMQIGVTDRYVPIAPRLVFTLASLGLLAALLLIAWRRRERLATAPLVWPLVPVFFAWRSLQNYFAFIPLFALVADEELATPPPETAPSARTAPRSTS